MSWAYFLSPTAIAHLRDHKKWSLIRFGYKTTKKYFQDIDEGLRSIAENHKIFPARKHLTGDSGLFIHPVREHYVIYVPVANGIHVAAILGRAQDIPHILHAHAAIFRRELAQKKHMRKKSV